MISRYQTRKHRFGWILGIFLLSLVLVSSHEAVPLNHQGTPDASTLKIEARESEASIILGKDLVLGPPLSTRASIIANSSSSNDVASTKINSFVGSTIVDRIPFGEQRANNVLRKPSMSKNETSGGSYIIDNRYQASKAPKTAWKRDSYLEALRHSRNSDDPREGIVQTDLKTKTNRREYVQGSVYRQDTEYGSPESSYASKNPRITYGGPSDSYPQSFKPSMGYSDHYNVPQNSYGPPQNSYGPPQDGPSFYPQTPSYGPPANSYPSPQQGYGPSVHTSIPTPIYGAPYALPDVSHISLLPSFDLGLPFALKLNAFTIAKIILKLVIFKMIVKFIAIICLLLFIPKLEIIKKKVSNKDEDNEERNLSSPYISLETLNSLEGIVRNSVEKYEAHNSTRLNSTEKCTTFTCRINETFHESWYDYLNLFNSYVEEERQSTERKDH
ncbi:Kazal-like domain-containing protein [Camponotus japonicus]